MKVYVDIIISGNTFDIVQMVNKPSNESALSVLHKIEDVIQRGLQYRSDLPDQLTNLSREEVLKKLWSAVQDVGNSYETKTNAYFFKKLRGIDKKQREIEKVIENIRHVVFPSLIRDLPSEIIQMIGLSGGIGVINQLGGLSLDANDNARAALIQKAREYGYKGSNHDEAKAFIRAFFKQIKDLVDGGIIPKECVVYKTETLINFEETIKKITSLGTENIFAIFAKTEIYKSENKKFRNFITKVFMDVLPTKTSYDGVNALSLAMNRQKDIVLLLLKHGVNPDSLQYPKGDSFLDAVAQRGFASCIPFLCEKKKYSPSDLNKAMVLAIRDYTNAIKSKEEITETVRILLKKGADPNIPANNGSPPLHWAAQQGYAEVVKLLLTYGAGINDPGSGGITALSFAIKPWKNKSKEGALATVKVLLENGADPNIFGNEGLPLHAAVKQGDVDIIALLLKYGANIKSLSKEGDPVLCAINGLPKEKCYATVKFLLENGADPNIPASNGSPPLLWAAQQGNAGVVKLLLTYGARINDPGSGGITALSFAIKPWENRSKEECHETVKVLLESGANPNIPANNGKTPLHFAAEQGDSDFIPLLIEKTANIQYYDNNGDRPLMLATSNNHKEAVDLLLALGDKWD